MSIKSKWFILCLALLFAFVFTTCEELGYTEEAIIPDADEPVITTQPQNASYKIGDTPVILTVGVTEPLDGGTLSYQWLKATDDEYDIGAGTEINGAIAKSYTIPDEEGNYKVYVKVTNSGPSGANPATVNSDLVQVSVNDPNNAEYPNIDADPVGSAYEWPLSGVTIAQLTVTASVTDGGSLSYQWYKSSTYSSVPTETGKLTGETNDTLTTASLTALITQAGTYYYFVEVTNTNNSVPGRDKSVTYSSPATIKALQVNATITVDTSTKYQYVRGFGVMAPFWSNAPQDKVSDYEKMFNPDRLGYNMLRIMIPVDGTSITNTMKKALNNELSGSKDRKHYYEIVKLVNRYNGYVLASPWSPPPSWKTNNSINGGGAGAKAELLKTRYSDYANYLNEYCKLMNKNGAPIYAVSIQNEPNYPASYDGCEWTGPQMRDFFRSQGRFTTGAKGWGGGVEIPTVLTMFGESANSPTATLDGLNDTGATGASQYIDLYARHLYGSQQVAVSKEVQAKGKEIWMTEMNINGGNADTYPYDSTYNYVWKFLNLVDVSIRMNNENAFIWWYGKRFYSQIGEGDYTTVDGQILPRGYALSHYAKYAIDAEQVALTITGTTGSGGTIVQGLPGVPANNQPSGVNFNHFSYNVDSTVVRATAFLSKDGNSISLVLFTPTNTSGGSGTNMGDIKIAFPSGFTATKVTAMRTKAGALGKKDGETVLLSDHTGAFINLPAGQILSVKFTK
jgi:O-glycosyl hydrolase